MSERTSWTLWIAPLLWSCAAHRPVVMDTAAGGAVDVEKMADRLAGKDVVFLGEEHRNRVGHRFEQELARALHRRRGRELILSLEMFDRDVQPVLNDYLAGRIDEATFRAKARPWPNYDMGYRPLIEMAKKEGLSVLATNMPPELRRKAAREGAAAVPPGPDVARHTTAPEDAYWEAFRKAMGENSGLGAEEMRRLYEAQCFKDDTMAETIADVLRGAWAEGRRPLVLHVCGSFHANYGRGVVARLRQRLPEAKVAVVSIDARKEVTAPQLREEPAGDYVVVVPEEPGETDRPHPRVAPEGHGHGKPAPAPHRAPAGTEEKSAPDPDARPALGFMPDYEVEGGVGVAAVRPGGPAEQAGLKEGDVIVEIDGLEVANIQDYMTVLGSLGIGEEVEVVVLRDGRRKKLKARVGKR